RTFFGSQPRRAQVPPYRWSSTMATRHPALRHWMAGVAAAAPVPRTTRSNDSLIMLRIYAGVAPGPFRAAAWLMPTTSVQSGFLDPLRAHIQELNPISDREFAQLASHLHPRRLRKKEHLYRQGAVCRWVGFITHGCV